ncbi:hypothetical protein O181_065339 [Austropuccinia psidii MF-1]|uniref:Integrase catalytic domain-containing protein n=1 Tax=Austropuccinia psidii MF-1 TaxID=1389203 RepID=A0A9Q3I4G1_9BASI|nr:hypothetical protein [Austropuccinia psidii MF-1]
MNLVDGLINYPEASHNFNEAFASTKMTVNNSKSAIGSTWTDEAITNIFFHLVEEAEEDDPYVASIQETPGNELLFLFDSGTTYHVTGDDNLFVEYHNVNMSLSVASAKQHPVIGRGTINLVSPSAKSRHSPIENESRNIVTEPGNVIVTDLMGPFPISVDKKITDNGGECSLQFLNTNLVQKGIIHEGTIPYEHHQSGKIERTNRTIAEAARSMLVDLVVDIAFWPYTFRQVVWVFNRVLHRKSIKTSYETVTGHWPDLAPLKVFGCEVYVYNLLDRKDLSTKARELIHIGAAEDAKGWIFWYCNQKHIFKCASAIFDENGIQMEVIGVLATSTILVKKIFDPSMIKEIKYQDNITELMNMSETLHLDAPSSYNYAQKWQEAIGLESKNMESMAVWTEVPNSKAN